MQRNTATNLNDFYGSSQGKVVRRLIGQALRSHWQNLKGMRVLTWGHTTPYLRPYLGECERLAALSPFEDAPCWPRGDANLVAVAAHDHWPIESNSIDRLLIVHGARSADALDAALREAWRVLKGDGRLLIVAPNRSGAWAWFDHTPFGRGTPYTLRQLRGHLIDNLFSPLHDQRALFVPPVSSRMILSTANAWEKAGRALFNSFGGVNIIEAEKQLYSPTLIGATQRHARLTPSPLPVATGKYQGLRKSTKT